MAKAITEMQKLEWETLLKMLATLSTTEDKKRLIETLDKLNKALNMDLGPQVDMFAFDNLLNFSQFPSLISKFVERCRELARDSSLPRMVRNHWNCIPGFLSENAQFLGWQHVSSFINDSLNYEQMTTPPSRDNEITEEYVKLECRASADRYKRTNLHLYASKEINELIEQGKKILALFLQRIDAILKLRNQIQPATQRPSLDNTVNVLLNIFQADAAFFDKVSKFHKEAEQVVTTMLSSNPDKFQQLKALHNNRVAWPHSAQLRREIEAAGFVYRPMIIKRDRCVCETCGTEVSGWCAWHDPVICHDFTRHPQGYLAHLRSQLEKIRREFHCPIGSELWSLESPAERVASKAIAEKLLAERKLAYEVENAETVNATQNPVSGMMPVMAFSAAANSVAAASDDTTMALSLLQGISRSGTPRSRG